MSYRFSSFENPRLITKKQAEQENREHALAGLAIGFAAGIIFGATVAILAAPKSGKDTRCAIKEAADDAVCDVKEKTVTVKDKIKDKIEAKKSCCCQDEAEADYAEMPLSEETGAEDPTAVSEEK